MHKTLFALLGLSSSLIAAQNNDHCAPEPSATCYPDDCKRCYCLGPENVIANAPVCPFTCDGDVSISVAGFYWNAHQDGMEYAIDNRVRNNVTGATLNSITAFTDANDEFNNLIDSSYLTPDFKWDWGFKLGLAYCSPCDGWDIGVYWTWYRGKAFSHHEAEPDDNHVLLPLWSAFSWPPGGINFATDIRTDWRLQLNLIDIELGRNFWTSQYLSIRPHVGIRVAYLEQDFDIKHLGGNLEALTILVIGGNGWGLQSALNNEVHFDNDFKGVGLKSGLDTTWNFGCGWSLYGNLAASIVYGRFNVDHHEWNRLATGDHAKTRVLETNETSAPLAPCLIWVLASNGWEWSAIANMVWRLPSVGSNTSSSIKISSGESFGLVIREMKVYRVQSHLPILLITRVRTHIISVVETSTHRV